MIVQNCSSILAKEEIAAIISIINNMSRKHTLIFLLIWIVAVQVFAWVAFNRLYITEPDKAQYSGRGAWPRQHKLDFLEMHERGDGAWYISIARKGYSFSAESQSNVNFFPLYPISMKVIREFIHPFTQNVSAYYQYVLSGTIVSITALFIAMVFLYKLLLLDFNKEVVSRTIFYMLIFPTAFAFTVVYSESLFLALSVLSFYFSRKHNWLMGGIFGGLAALTRPVGILLIIPLLIEFITWVRKNKKEKRLININILFLLLIPAGLGVFMIFLAKTFNDPLAFVHAAQAWGRGVHTLDINPVTSLLNIANVLQAQIGNNLDFTPASKMNIFIEIAYLFFGLILSIIVMNKIRFSYGLYALLGVLMPVGTGVLVGQGRYLLPLFPLFIPIALWSIKNEMFQQTYTIISLLFLGFHIILFVNSYLTY